MRKIVAATAIAFLATITFAQWAYADDTQRAYRTDPDNSIDVREGSDDASGVGITLPPGKVIIAWCPTDNPDERAPTGELCRVRYVFAKHFKNGYVHREELRRIAHLYSTKENAQVFLTPDQDTKTVGTISKGKNSRGVCFDKGPDGEDRWCSVNYQGRIGYVLADKMDSEMSESEREAAGLGSHQEPENPPKVAEAAPQPPQQSDMQKRTAFKAEQQMMEAINQVGYHATVNGGVLSVDRKSWGQIESAQVAALKDLDEVSSDGNDVLIKCNVSGCVHDSMQSSEESYFTLHTDSASYAARLARIIDNDVKIWHAVQ